MVLEQTAKEKEIWVRHQASMTAMKYIKPSEGQRPLWLVFAHVPRVVYLAKCKFRRVLIASKRIIVMTM